MYDMKRRIEVHYCTVDGLIEQLKKLPPEAEVFCCGDQQFFLHMTADGKTLCIDTDALDDEYDEEDE